MPHSVRGVGGAEGAWGKGKNGVRLGVMRQCHPGVQSPRSFRFDLRVRASTEQRLVLTWIYIAALFIKLLLFVPSLA